MADYGRRLDRLEERIGSDVPPVLCVLVAPGEDADQRIAEVLRGYGLTPATARRRGVSVVPLDARDAAI